MAVISAHCYLYGLWFWSQMYSRNHGWVINRIIIVGQQQFADAIFKPWCFGKVERYVFILIVYLFTGYHVRQSMPQWAALTRSRPLHMNMKLLSRYTSVHLKWPPKTCIFNVGALYGDYDGYRWCWYIYINFGIQREVAKERHNKIIKS